MQIDERGCLATRCRLAIDKARMLRTRHSARSTLRETAVAALVVVKEGETGVSGFARSGT